MVRVAGRIKARRNFGKLIFIKLQDLDGDVQLYFDKNMIKETQEGGFSMVKNLLDVGDIVGGEGWMKVVQG